MRAGTRLRIILTLVVAIAAVAGAPAAAQAQLTPAFLTMTGCALGSDTSAWKTASNGGKFGFRTFCPPGKLDLYPSGLSLGGGSATSGQYASWYTSVPPGMLITYIAVNGYFARGLNAVGWVGDWVLEGGRMALGNSLQGPGVDYFGAPGTHANIGTMFGWSIQCRATKCSNNGDLIQVGNVSVTAEEYAGPTITPTGLWLVPGWVRGSWPVTGSANGPSGVCAMVATMNGHFVGSAPARAPDHSVWDQCGGAMQLNASVDTTSTDYPQAGPATLILSDSDAAGLGGPISRTIYIDNVRPTISLSGPTDVSSAAGTQYITATATAGPSHVHGIMCSLDNAPAQWFPASTAHVPVSGVGVHRLQCGSVNNSYDSSGQANWSQPANWTLSIRAPSESLVSFVRVADRLKCGIVREHVKIAAGLVKVHRHGKLVWVKRGPKTVVRRVVRCHPRVVMKRVCSANHCTKQRVPVLPHAVGQSTWHSRFGEGATVSGWLGTSGGIALSGQQVQVMTAPNNGSNAFTQAADVTTDANGIWSVRLPPGPSRIVEAVYTGAPTVEPAWSSPIHLIVPAKVNIHIAPRSTRWGGTIAITGRVLGGYIPGGKLLRLRIGIEGVRGTVGIPSVQQDGRYRTTWTFSAGRGVVRYWFSVSTLNETDYPFAPASSRRVYVTVGSG